MKYNRLTAGLCAGLIACSGIAGSVPATGFSIIANAAESGQLGDNLTWTLDDNGVLTVSGEGAWKKGAQLPDEIRSKIRSAVIEDGITSVPAKTFSGCRYLKTLTLPEGITEIADELCSECINLASVTIPDSVTKIGNNAFNNCNVLKEITLPDGVTSIGKQAFYTCGKLTSLLIPDSVTSIGFMAFGSCASLKTVTLPAVQPEMDTNLFEASGLESVAIPDGYTSIPSRCFQRCASLTSLSIPESVTKIGDGAFFCCADLTDIPLPENISEIGTDAFLDTAWLENRDDPFIVLGHTLHILENVAGDFVIPDGVEVIGDKAFWYNSNLTSLTIPDSVKKIGNYAFFGIELTSVTIPDSVTEIGDYAFSRSGLTSVTVPESVEKIGSGAFDTCPSLESITFLNPECAFPEEDGVISNDVVYMGIDARDYIYSGVIRGYADSTAQAYAEKCDFTFEVLEDKPVSGPNPDMNGDGKITASDAQTILIAYAEILAGNPSGLTPEQEAAADVDGNSSITALDAQYTLNYFLCNTILDTPTTWEEIIPN